LSWIRPGVDLDPIPMIRPLLRAKLDLDHGHIASHAGRLEIADNKDDVLYDDRRNAW
jgi:hypothetical protein